MPYTYILRCNDGSLYTGSAKDLAKRILLHQSGKGAKYTRSHLPVELVYYEEYAQFNEALRREKEIKSWPRSKKLKLLEEKI